jgi:secernin
MCDSVVAVGSETAAGTTLFAKNSDRPADECQPLRQFPEACHPPEARLACTHIAISQVAETYRVLGHSPWWVWGFEHGVNEHAVAIGNQTVFSKEPIEEEPGLIGMDLVRLGLERGRSAREALEVIAGLIEVHGQGGCAFSPGGGGYHNSFVLADGREAWLLETSNRRWAARRTVLDGVSNHFCIRRDWEIGSRDLASFARAEGWSAASGRLDVTAAYRNTRVPGRISEGRQRRSRVLLVPARGPHDVNSLIRILRDHLEGGAAWQPGSTADDERHFTLCAHSEPVHWTTASLVAPLPKSTEAPWPTWVSFATPCSGIFLPVYVQGVIPAILARGAEQPSDDSAWWIFKRLQDVCGVDPERHTPVLRAGWAGLEESIERRRIEVENVAEKLAASHGRDKAAAHLTDFMEDVVAEVIDRARELTYRVGD